MIISVNNKDYRKEIHDIVKIYYPNEEVSFSINNCDINILIHENNINISLPTKENNFSYPIEHEVKTALKRALFLFLKELNKTEIPWGILVGIRPSKIALKLIEQGYEKGEILKYYEEKYLTSKSKAELCYEVAQKEAKYINPDKDTISIYIGMPFCPTRCSYCSFASNPIKGCGDLVTPYLNTLEYEIKCISQYILEKNIKVQCIYFGGGTPTAVNDIEFEYIMRIIDENLYKQHSIIEYTVECGRPDSITNSKLDTMKKYNVSRISINPQTMNYSTLKRIGRHHSVDDVVGKFSMARQKGFDNINMDIIVGLPGEGLDEVSNTCREILKLNPESITVHGMSLKRSSKLHEEHVNNKIQDILESNSQIYEMYDLSRELADSLDMKPYYMYRQKNMVGNMENIGYSKINKECIYNIQMIEEKQTIIALGADAISKIVSIEDGNIERVANVKDVKLYIERIDEMIELKIKLLDRLYS